MLDHDDLVNPTAGRAAPAWFSFRGLSLAALSVCPEWSVILDLLDAAPGDVAASALRLVEISSLFLPATLPSVALYTAALDLLGQHQNPS